VIANLIYVMCAGTSAACAVLLLRGYSSTKVGLLFWSALCFVGLALSNALLVVDLLFVPEVSLMTARQLITLTSLVVLIYGLIWEAR
jgi:hypothetical protein